MSDPLICRGIQQHARLRSAKTPVHVEQSEVLSDAVAAAKTYGDSWTCRSSTELLIKSLAACGVRLVLDSAGKDAFDWGRAGRVSYHYFGVDDLSWPTVLLDPTACTNFARDVQPGGLMLGPFRRVGRALEQPVAAQRVVRKIRSGGVGGLLVLTSEAEIVVFRAALDEAARYKVRVQRSREQAAQACAG